MSVHMVTLRNFDSDHDTTRLREWLRRPHVKQWWGMQQSEDLVSRALDTHAVIEVDGIAVGYLCWEIPSQLELEQAGLTDLPKSLMDIDILIGEPEYLGHGVGPDALGLLLERLRTRSDVRFAGLATSVDNKRAKRAYEKAGFDLFREFDDPESGRCYYLLQQLKP